MADKSGGHSNGRFSTDEQSDTGSDVRGRADASHGPPCCRHDGGSWLSCWTLQATVLEVSSARSNGPDLNTFFFNRGYKSVA